MTDKKDYCVDGKCTAKIIEEKTCKNFQPWVIQGAGIINICRYQGTGCTCEYKESEENNDK